jgi:hypothetical protein
MDDVRKINEAWHEEGSISRLGLRPSADPAIVTALVPPGGDWRCVAEEGAVSRSIVWNGIEIALVNPRGDMRDYLEGQIAMGLSATPVMDRALRVIWALSKDAANLELIGKIARAAVHCVELPAPRLPEPESDDGEGPS